LAIFATMLVCIPLAGTTAAFAGDENRFSLGYGSLTPSRTEDPKAQQFGQLTAKYRLGSSDIFKPYVGTGLAYSYQPDINPGTTTKIKTGVAGQAGFSVLLDEKSSLNFDYKFLELGSGARSTGSSPPQSVGVGLEIKF
jgi:outer membrane protein W